MNTREKTLVAGLTAALVVWAGFDSVTTALWGPIEERQRTAETLDRRIQEHEADYARIEQAQRQLKGWTTRSLPPDPSVASTLYQNWLVELTQKVGLDNAVVNPNRVVPQGTTYFRIPFTVQGQCKLDTVCDLLFELSQADLLHKVTQVALEATEHDVEPTLDATIQIEALALMTAPPRDELFESRTGSPAVRPGVKSRESYDAIVERNVFVRGYEPPAPAAPQKPGPPSPADDPGQVYLIASIRRDGRREAWLYDRTKKQQHILTEGASLDVVNVTCKVISIADDHVVVDVSGTRGRLELGQNLRQVKAPDAGPESANG
jgi:hypothetical protein